MVGPGFCSSSQSSFVFLFFFYNMGGRETKSLANLVFALIVDLISLLISCLVGVNIYIRTLNPRDVIKIYTILRPQMRFSNFIFVNGMNT